MPFLTLETLLVTEKTTLSFERIEGGKIRVKAISSDDAKTILPDQVLEVRSIDGRLRFARKGREPDAGDQPKKAFDPEEFYGSDNGPEERHACQDGDTRVGDTVTGGDNVSREAHVYVCPAGKLLTSAWSSDTRRVMASPVGELR
jgi:hypothetical protein